MKKFTKVLLALLLALTMAFVFAACGDDSSDDDGDGDGDGGTPPVVGGTLDLAAHLATLDVDEANFGLILPGSKGFQKAGGVSAKVVLVGTGDDAVKGVTLTFTEEWAGIDLLDSFFHFKTGDRIVVTGTVDAVTGTTDGAEFVIQDKPGAWGTPAYQLTGIAADTAISADITLTDGMISMIAAGKPKALRIQGNNVEASSLVLTLTQIKVSR